MPPPLPTLVNLTDEWDRDEPKKGNDQDNVFGLRLYLCGLVAEAGSAAGEGETQAHPHDGTDASVVGLCLLST